MQELLAFCIECAYAAGDRIMRYYAVPPEERGVSYKADRSPVTAADRETNELIVGRLRQRCAAWIPGGEFAVLAEESVDDPKRLSQTWCFIVDPLDGTKEFLAGIPEFTVNIALARAGKPVLGVVYAPATRELYYALEGRGACKTVRPQEQAAADGSALYRPQDRIAVSTRTESLIAMHSRYHLDAKTKELLERNRHRFASVITAGSALKVCRIAEGLADVYYRFGETMEWDTCAEQLIVEEAGGIMRAGDVQESILQYNRKDSCNRTGFYVINRPENKLEGVRFYGE